MENEKTLLSLLVEKYGYKRKWFRTFEKPLYNKSAVKQVIKFDLYEDKIDYCYIEYLEKIISKEDISNINLAFNRLTDDVSKIRKELQTNESK